jgi:endonuclease-3 related protein
VSLRDHIQTLFAHYPQQNWWPAHSRFEVIAGAILVQNTAWGNVEKALSSLRRAKLLNISGIRGVSLARLEALVKSAGFYRQKALRLKAFVQFLDERYGGSLMRMFKQNTAKLRTELLQVHGIGPETADSILLYAGGHPVFVVDAYTRRIFGRHQLAADAGRVPYDHLRSQIEAEVSRLLPLVAIGTGSPRHPSSRVSRMPRDAKAAAYNDLHAMIVRVGVDHCRSKPNCTKCPLQPLL